MVRSLLVFVLLEPVRFDLVELAKEERNRHMQMYPGWSARDNYGLKKKRSSISHPEHPQKKFIRENHPASPLKALPKPSHLYENGKGPSLCLFHFLSMSIT